MYFDEDGDLAHEFYEEVLPRYEISTSFDVVSLRVVTTLKNQEKGWQEKNAKNREESQVRPFVLCSIYGVCCEALSTQPIFFQATGRCEIQCAVSSRRLPNHSLFGLSLDPKAEKSDIMELFPLPLLLQPPWRSAWKLWWSKADLQKDRKPKVKIISVIQNHLISFFVLNILWSELYSFTVLHTLHQSWLSLAGQDDIKTREPAIFTQ